MSDALKTAIHAAALRLLEPLAKWLLEGGLGVGDVQTLLKVAFVRAARDQGLKSGTDPGRPNVSRISVVTGLTRGEVASILAADARAVARDHGRQRTERVLSGWWNDADFQDRSGKPARLPLRGSRRSFAALVERYSGERSLLASILGELLRVKAVRRLPNGHIEALSRTYATVRWDPEGVVAFGEQLREHCATLLHNLKEPTRTHYVRRVLNTQLDPKFIPVLTRYLEQQIDTLADSLDDALNDPKQTLTGAPAASGAASLGVACYVFETSGDESPRNKPRPRRRSRRSVKRPKR